jgi:Flp pilus assembly pilin Flp
MVRKASGASMVEYIVLIVLLVGLVGAALLSLVGTIWNRLESTNVDLGS